MLVVLLCVGVNAVEYNYSASPFFCCEGVCIFDFCIVWRAIPYFLSAVTIIAPGRKSGIACLTSFKPILWFIYI